MDKLIVWMIGWSLFSYFIFYKCLAPSLVVMILRKNNPGIENYIIIEFLDSYYLPIPKKLKNEIANM